MRIYRENKKKLLLFSIKGQQNLIIMIFGFAIHAGRLPNWVRFVTSKHAMLNSIL